MKVSFKILTMFKSEYVLLNNVSWLRFTENVVCIECKDGRVFRHNLKNICELEVKCNELGC